jgi:hypothetical protein
MAMLSRVVSEEQECCTYGNNIILDAIHYCDKSS